MISAFWFSKKRTPAPNNSNTSNSMRRPIIIIVSRSTLPRTTTTHLLKSTKISNISISSHIITWAICQTIQTIGWWICLWTTKLSSRLVVKSSLTREELPPNSWWPAFWSNRGVKLTSRTWWRVGLSRLASHQVPRATTNTTSRCQTFRGHLNIGLPWIRALVKIRL